jgi:RNase H-like domain found in reverse transcriptase
LFNESQKNSKTKLLPVTNKIFASFDTIKQEFSRNQTLYDADTTKHFLLITDASDHAIGRLLVQSKNAANNFDKLTSNYISQLLGFKPISCYSHLLTETEKQYSTIEKELLAVNNTVANNKHFLNSTRDHILIPTDHRNLEALTKFKVTKQRHLKWLENLSQHKFPIRYLPRKKNEIADTLSRPLHTIRPRLLLDTFFLPETLAITKLLHNKQGERERKEKAIEEIHKAKRIFIRESIRHINKQEIWINL